MPAVVVVVATVGLVLVVVGEAVVSVLVVVAVGIIVLVAVVVATLVRALFIRGRLLVLAARCLARARCTVRC